MRSISRSTFDELLGGARDLLDETLDVFGPGRWNWNELGAITALGVDAIGQQAVEVAIEVQEGTESLAERDGTPTP